MSSGTPAQATPAPSGGRGITITPGTMPLQPAGTALFDQLGANDVEPGDPNASIPADPTARAAATTQHYRAGSTGAGLLKPFAAALVLGVWAVLLLYVSRQAKRLDATVRPARSAVLLEDLP